MQKCKIITLASCITCAWEHCQMLTEEEKTKIYHLEEMKDEHRED